MSSYTYNDNKSYEDYYNKVAGNTLRSRGAQTVRGKKGRKRTSKAKYRKKLRNLILTAGAILVIIQGISYVDNYFDRKKELNEALDFMSVKIVSYLEQANVDYAINADKSIVILDEDMEDLSTLSSIIQKDGFSRDETFYIVSKICGDKAFDKIVQTSGYENSDDFLRSNYFSGPLSSSGETFLAKYPDENEFENNVEVNVVKNIKSLQGQSSKKVDSKGMNK